MLAVSNDKLVVGEPTVAGATVTASVIGDGKAKKVIVYKYKRKLDTIRKMVTDSSTQQLRLKNQRLICHMIKVTVYKTVNHDYAGLDVLGHAGYSEAGSDVVCAAVSVLVINTLNSIERFTSDKISLVSDEETGMIEFRFIRKPSHDAKLLFKSMVLGLQEIEEDSEYEPYIDIIFKEV